DQLFSRLLPRRGIVRDLKANLLFCPFTAPYFFDSQTPVVSIIYDLQYLRYPQFFSAEDRAERHRTATDAARSARRVVCISDYVRSTVIAKLGVPPDRAVTIPIQLPRRLPTFSCSEVGPLLERTGLKPREFLLY